MAKKTQNKSDLPEPGKETREVFVEAVNAARNLKDVEGLHIRLDEAGRAEIDLNAEKLAELCESGNTKGLSASLLSDIIRTEIQSLLNAATQTNAVAGIEANIPSRIVKDVGVEELSWRLREVEKHLLPHDFKERVILRRTTKGFVFKSCAWEVSVRKHDRKLGKVSDLPYGSVSIMYSCPQTDVSPFRIGGEEFMLELPVMREPKQLLLELHRADVEELIRVLSDLRDNLEQQGKV